MNLKIVSETLEWLEHKTKPLFVIVALLLYAFSLYQLGLEVSPTKELDAFLIGALSNLSIPFGIILLQELLELVVKTSESNLLSARHQYEIVVLVIVRSFFKKFGSVSGYVDAGKFNDTIEEAMVKLGALILLGILVFIFRYLSRSKYLQNYVTGQVINAYKQILVVILVLFVLGYMLFVQQSFDEIDFIRLVFTGIIIIDAIFLLIAIMRDSSFESVAFESLLIISLIFARFPLFASNTLSYILSVMGVFLGTFALYLMYRGAEINHSPPGQAVEH